MAPNSNTARAVVVPFTPDGGKEAKDHFIREGAREFAGRHLIVDLWGANNLGDQKLVEQAMKDGAKAAGATIIYAHLHKFGEAEHEGITGVLVLAESHITVHTWPERGFAAFDAFMCGDANPRAVVAFLQAAFKPERIVQALHHRGEVTQ